MSFFSSIDNFFHKLFGSQAAWERTASVTLSVAAPLLETIVGLTAGEPASAAIAKVVTMIQNDMAAVSTVLTASGPTPSIAGFLNAITTNLDSLVSAGQIKNPATQAQVEAIVKTIAGEMAAIIAIVPPAVPAAA